MKSIGLKISKKESTAPIIDESSSSRPKSVFDFDFKSLSSLFLSKLNSTATSNH